MAALVIPLDLSDVHAKLDQILANQATLLVTQTAALGSIMADLTEITTEVTDVRVASDAAVLLLDRLADLVEANLTDQAALTGLVAELRSTEADLVDAVFRNTPVEPEPTPEPEPAPEPPA